MTHYVSKTGAYRPHLTPAPDRLHGKVALVTGGARGIGRAIASRFAQEGADVAIVDRDLGVPLENMPAFQADVADRDQVERVVRQIMDGFGQIDILVNNAGMIVFGSLLDCRPEDWDRMLAVDLTGAFHFTQIVGRAMVERNRGGRLIHVGSTASLFPAPKQAAYSVAKAGLGMLSRQAALELAALGITSNLLCPMGAVTDINRDLLNDPAIMQALEAAYPGRTNGNGRRDCCSGGVSGVGRSGLHHRR